MIRFSFLLCLAATGVSLHLAHGGPLQQAKVNRIVNEVRIVDPRQGLHAAALQEVVKDDLGIKTGQKSRAELLFQDETLTRLGAETFFSFQPGTRDLTLEQGTLLLQVPKGLGGAKIRTAAVTAAITGTTIMMEYFPGKIVKVLVLEGSLRLSLNSRMGEVITLTPGRMLMMKPGDKRLPEPIDVDLAKIVKTSTLVRDDAFVGKDGKGKAPLPSMGLIAQEISRQGTLKGKAGLVETNLLIEGNGNLVTVASPDQLNALQNGTSSTNANLFASSSSTPASTTDTSSLVASNNSPGTSTTNPATSTGSTGRATDSRTDAGDGNTPIVQPPTDTSNGSGTSGDGSNPPTPSSGTSPGDGDSGTTPVVTPPVVTPPVVTPPVVTQPVVTPPVVTPPPTVLATILAPSPYIYTKDTKLNLAEATITTSGTKDNGAVYYHATAGVTPADYVFGSTSVNDVSFKFDLAFGLRDRVSPPAEGVAVFRFTGLTLGEMKDFAGKNSRSDLALISTSNVTSGAGAKDLNLEDLHSLLLAADAGSITLSNKIHGGDKTFRALDLYSRNSDVKLTGEVDLKDAALFVEAGGAVFLQSKIEADAVTVFAMGNVTLSNEMKTDHLSLRGAVVDLGSQTQAGTLDVTAGTFMTGKSQTVSSGTLDIDLGGISAAGFSLQGFTDIKSQGSVNARVLSASNSILIGGALNLGTAGPAPTLTAPTIAIAQGIFAKPATGSNLPGLTLSIFADQVLISSAPGGINGINLEGADKALVGVTPAANGGTLYLGTDAKPITGDVTIEAPVSTTSGDSLTSALLGGNGGTVSVTSKGHISVNSLMQVSSDGAVRASKSGGTIHLESKRTSGPAITVQNSGQLLSLLSATATGAGGKIEFISAGGDVLVNGGTIAADRGLVNILNSGANGLVTLTNANLRGDVIKVAALGTNGEVRIGGGTLDAASTLKLYANGTSGTVHFVDNVTLSSGLKTIIAAHTVEIDNGKRVQINGLPAQVYTDNGRFSGAGGNGATTGRFTGLGANVSGYAGAPGL